MLTHLHVEHFALIDDLDCSFKDNMNVIIGETGAGKSILMQAISLLLGSKSDFDKIRNGESKAFIEGEFVLSKNLYAKLNEDFSDYLEDEVLIVSRSLDIKGKSTQRLNGHIVPLGIIKSIAKYLIDVHSPQEELFFYDEKKQIDILDSFIKNNIGFKDDQIYFENYKNAYLKVKEVEDKIYEYEDILKQEIDKDYLMFQLDELEKANIQENELEDLEAKYASLSSLAVLSGKIDRYLQASSEGLNLIFQAKRELDSINDTTLTKYVEKYVDGYYQIDEAHSEIKEKFDELIQQSYNLEKIKERLFYLRSLKRKYGSTTKEILSFKDNIQETLNKLDNASYQLVKLKKEREELLVPLFNHGEELNNIRKKYALKLTEIINQELKELLFENAYFEVRFKECEYSFKGTKSVQFLLSANKGMEALPLKDSISLGESSRLLLAFKKVFFEFSHVETLIFDEIDIGISGKAALAIGNKIKELANKTQILVISHLGQVASKGKYFYLVKKEVINDSTVTNVVELEKDLAIKEIAKMINNGKEDKTSSDLVKSWLKS